MAHPRRSRSPPALSQDDTANAHTLDDIAYHLCGAGTLDHTVGDSFLYSISVKPGPDDDHVPSTYRLGRGVRFSPAFAAELRAATAPLGSMPDHADGDLNVRMRHDNSVKTPTYHGHARRGASFPGNGREAAHRLRAARCGRPRRRRGSEED